MHNSVEKIYGMHSFWWSLTILIALGIIFYLLDKLRQKSKNKETLKTLKKKFAKNEMSEGEYKKSKKILKKIK